MNKGKIKWLLAGICVLTIGIIVFASYSGTEKSAPDHGSNHSEGELVPGESGQENLYPEEAKPYVDAIRFFASTDWDNWKKMQEVSPLFTEDAFVQSIYYLGKIDMTKYDRSQKGIQEISQNLTEAKDALNYLIKSRNGEEGFDEYEGAQMLSESIAKMNEVKNEAEKVREKYQELFR